MYYLYYYAVSLAKYTRPITAGWLLIGKRAAGNE
jgi:hypothetical protein